MRHYWKRVGNIRVDWEYLNKNIKILTDISFMPDFEMEIKPDPNGSLFKSLLRAGWTPPQLNKEEFINFLQDILVKFEEQEDEDLGYMSHKHIAEIIIDNLLGAGWIPPKKDNE